ncbi:hypothetical protein [Nocardioides daejeonensis]|uniref:hypothetical protein n=1 Tax=Nocardioides daejeonensis TaxID=1046556 RepID=UPI000D740A89|nr:hypothetical protein [Nocardioides daejeonensis]
MKLTEDSFRALARSSPWRWRSVHFTRRGGEEETVEAWVTRPGRMVVVDAGGRRHEVVENAGEGRAIFVSGPGPVPQPQWLTPQQTEPVRRLDGLVAHRPDDLTVCYDDPMWQDYQWVAMLDPVELSEHTIVTDLRDGEHRGRPAWRAVVAAADGYEPRCGCCPLLWGEISERDEAAGGGTTWRDHDPQVVYPIAYEVALDLQTGIVVELTPIGGSRSSHTLDVEVHDAR